MLLVLQRCLCRRSQRTTTVRGRSLVALLRTDQLVEIFCDLEDLGPEQTTQIMVVF